MKTIIDEKIPVWGSPIDNGALEQIRVCARTAERVALMAGANEFDPYKD